MQPSSALRLRGFVPVELVRHEAVAGRADTPAHAGRSAAAVTDLTAGGGPWPDSADARPDPVAARADPGTLFLDADL